MNNNKIRNKFTKTQLERLLQDKNYLEIANDFGIKDKCILYHLKKLKVERDLYYLRRNKESLRFNSRFFSNLNNEKSAYWFGFILADGYIQSKRHRLRIQLGNKDYTHLVKFANDINLDKKHIQYINCNNTNVIELTNPLLYKDLIYHGCRDKKSLNMEWITINDKNMNHMIRGYFDGDGHIGKYERKKSFSICGSIKFLMGLCNYLQCEHPIYKQGKIYKLISNNRNEIEFWFNYMYHNANIYLERKYNKFKEILEV